MKFELVRPCPKCPFRLDIPEYLRGGRAEQIARDLAGGASFACHETTVLSDEDDGSMVETPDSQMCAGAMIALMREDNPNGVMRLMERLGRLDLGRLDMRAPVGPIAAFVRHHGGGEEEFECCSVCGPDCEAPAGMMVNGVAVPSTSGGETSECPECGEAVCGACSDAEGQCQWCAGVVDEEERVCG